MVAAIELARAGREVTVLDSQAVGAGATGRSLGIISSAAVGAGFGDPAETVHGRPRADWHAERVEAERYLLALLVESGMDVGLRQGVLVLAPTPRNHDLLARTVASRNALYETNARMLDRAELEVEAGGDVHGSFPGGLLLPEARHLDPGRMMQALSVLAGRLGVVICEKTSVRGLYRDRDDGVRIATAGGDIDARDVLFATGGYTDRVWPYLWRRVTCLPSVAAASERLPETLVKAIFPAGRAVLINRFRGFLCRPTPDGRRIVLAGPVAVSPRSPEKDAEALRRYFARLYPALAEVKLTHCWHGLIAATTDGRAHAGRHEHRWYAVGASGILSSAAAGRRIAACMRAGNPPSDPAFRRWPLRSFPRLLWSGVALSTAVLDLAGRSRSR